MFFALSKNYYILDICQLSVLYDTEREKENTPRKNLHYPHKQERIEEKKFSLFY